MLHALLATTLALGASGPGAPAAPAPAAASARLLTPDDVYNLREVGDPQRSPDGAWVAYTVRRDVRETDRRDTDVWMARWDGTRELQVTSAPASERTPRWSPDGRYLSFLSARHGAKDSQLWLLDRAGGEAIKVTDVAGGISDYSWSPDGKRVVLVVDEADPADAPPAASAAGDARPAFPSSTPKPIVIDRWYFKVDTVGYLRGGRAHLFLFDVATRKVERLTGGTSDEESPSWSPDGRLVAYVSRHAEPGADLDRAANRDVFVVEPRAGAQPRRLTTHPGDDIGPLAWSPDSRSVAYLAGDEPRFYAYVQEQLAVVGIDGGAPRVLTAALDRPVDSPVWSGDGRHLYFVVMDDRSRQLARIPAAGGEVERLTERGRVVTAPSYGRDGGVAVLVADGDSPAEVFAWENGRLRALSRQNDAWLAGVRLGRVEELTSQSADGTEVHGLLTFPPDAPAGRTLPTLLRIHGGPDSQDQHELHLERQVLAAAGYLVVSVNYRGSAGRGGAYQKAIFAEWGKKEVMDLLGAVDDLQRRGLADPSRLGIGGWSYGGMLTNYTIASDRRFRAAISGAGTGNHLGTYGTDMYIQQWEFELGLPWEKSDLYLELSYPFLHADRIATPTLFMGGASDWNVPITGSEQMYQALRTLGVPTQLVVYPDQPHTLTVPSYRKDRLERYVAWYGKYLAEPAAPAPATP